MMKLAAWFFGSLFLAGSAASLPALAQGNYPSAPIRLVLGFPPGSLSDIVARLLAQKLSEQMNASVIVDNKSGASSNLGAEFVAKSNADGYTLLFNTPDVILSRAFGEKTNYDLFKDLTPVGLTASLPFLLVVHPSMPNTVADFIAHVRANPGKLAYGSSGIGGITALTSLLFLQANGLSALHVPYKGAGPAVIDLVGGRLQFEMLGIGTVLPYLTDKRLKALAIASLKRTPVLPDVPTLDETVMPGFQVVSWFGVMAPAKTPTANIRKLNTEIVKALQIPEVRAQFAQAGVDTFLSTPAEYSAYLKSELDRWSKVIKAANVKLN